ncbi:MAG TPA: hypothetical protein VF760_10370, partial [Xanthobacteraceae bacterium]
PKEHPKRESRSGGNGSNRTARPKPATGKTELSLALSASLRDELLREIEALNGNDEAALWARRRGGAKNSLNAADAEQVEEAFRGSLATIANEQTNERATEATRRGHPGGHRKKRRRAALVEKSVLALPTPRRIRDRDHVKSVAKQPCLVCGRRPADAHHLRFAQAPALGRMVSDEFTVPLCRGHHREVHRCGDEAAWWNKTGIDPTAAARSLWLKTHPLPTASDAVGSKLRNEANLETRFPCLHIGKSRLTAAMRLRALDRKRKLESGCRVATPPATGSQPKQSLAHWRMPRTIRRSRQPSPLIMMLSRRSSASLSYD